MTREEALELFKKASDVAGNYLEYVEIVSMHNINIVLSEIFNEHEAQLKTKDEKITKEIAEYKRLLMTFETICEEKNKLILDFKEMVEWMEQNSNSGLCAYYNAKG